MVRVRAHGFRRKLDPPPGARRSRQPWSRRPASFTPTIANHHHHHPDISTTPSLPSKSPRSGYRHVTARLRVPVRRLPRLRDSTSFCVVVRASYSGRVTAPRVFATRSLFRLCGSVPCRYPTPVVPVVWQHLPRSPQATGADVRLSWLASSSSQGCSSASTLEKPGWAGIPTYEWGARCF